MKETWHEGRERRERDDGNGKGRKGKGLIGRQGNEGGRQVVRQGGLIAT